MKRTGFLKRGTKPMRQCGKRGNKRKAMNAELNKLGITHCEIRLPGCWNRSGLTWAHATKSRFIITDEDWLRAARACISCHQKIEVMKHAEMAAYVDGAIAAR